MSDKLVSEEINSMPSLTRFDLKLTPLPKLEETPQSTDGSKIQNESFDPDMYDPDNLLPREEDADWFEVIDKPINLRGRILTVKPINESLKIPDLELRPSPPCPKCDISPWLSSTVEPDINIKSLY